jgi:hypothetical protein
MYVPARLPPLSPMQLQLTTNPPFNNQIELILYVRAPSYITFCLAAERQSSRLATCRYLFLHYLASGINTYFTTLFFSFRH